MNAYIKEQHNFFNGYLSGLLMILNLKISSFIILLLIIAFGNANADESTTKTSVFMQTLPDFMQVCDFRDSSVEGVPFTFHIQNCYDYIHGIRNLKRLVGKHFGDDQQSTATIVSYERSPGGLSPDSHAGIQLQIMRLIIPENFPIEQRYRRPFGQGRSDYPAEPGYVITFALRQPLNLGLVEYYASTQTLNVVAVGNEDRNEPSPMIDPGSVKLDAPVVVSPLEFNTNSFLRAAGYRMVNLIEDCGEDSHACEPSLAKYTEEELELYFPDSWNRGERIGSNQCGTKRELCVLAPWDSLYSSDSNGRSTSRTVTVGGTSWATPYAGAVVWLVSEALKHLYEWEAPGIGQRQAMMMASAIIKSCAIDLGEEGVDNVTGLGLLYAGCMEEGDGLVEDPMKLIKTEFLFNERYTYPTLKSSLIHVQLRVLLDGLLPQ